MNKIRIEPTDNPKMYRIFLDDIDVSKYLNRVEFSLSAGNLPDITLHIAAAVIEVPENLAAFIVPAQKDGKP